MKDLTKGNIYKNFILFAIPMVLSGLLSQTYHIVDTAIAGKFLGEEGIASIGATAQILSLVSSFFWGFNSGFAIYIARLFGAKEYKRMKNDMINIILVLVLIIITASIAVISFSGWILDIINVDEKIRIEAQKYFCVCVGGMSIIILNNTFSKLLNSLGISVYPFLMSMVSAAINICGNILSVTVFGLGVLGIALSSVVSAMIVNFLYIFKLKNCFGQLGIVKEKIKFSFHSFKISLGYSLPTCLQQTAMYIAAAAMSPIVNGIGSSATAGYTVVMRIYDINAGVYQNSSLTLGNYTAQCVGAKKYNKISKGLFVGLVQGIVILLPFLLVCCLFAKEVNSLFFSEQGGKALQYAVRFSSFYLPFVLFNLINNLFHSFFRGLGEMRLLIISTLVGSIFRIAAGIVFSHYFAMEGIYIGWVISWIAEAIFLMCVYIIKFNSKTKIEKSVKEI